MKKARPKTYLVRNLGEVARFFGVAPNTVDKWRTRGMPGKSMAWDLSAIAQWTRAREVKLRKEEADRDPGRLVKRYQARLMKVKLEAERGRLIKRSDHLGILRSICSDFQRGLLGLATSLAGQIRGLGTTQADQAIRDRFTELLEDLSEHAGDGGTITAPAGAAQGMGT